LRRLIINADDFGLTRGVNRAIGEAHQKGIVTSTTLMANGGAFDDATRLAASLPELSVGCHVVLVDGSPILPATEVTSLLENRSDHFPRAVSNIMVRALTGRTDPEQIQAEVSAQIQKLKAANIPVSHLDTHKHTHLFPQILKPILKAAQACGVKAIRNPFGRMSLALTLGRPDLWKRHFQVSLLNRFAASFRRAVKEAGMVTTDGSLGVVATGALDEGLFRSMIDNLPEGTWEFVCHPGYNDTELGAIRTRLRASREQELAVLTADSSRRLLDELGIELISYANLRQ
jgi:chitin disaccharide deacetylase